MCWQGIDKVIKERSVVAIRIFEFDVNHLPNNSSINRVKRKMGKCCAACLTFVCNHRECVLLCDGNDFVHEIFAATTDFSWRPLIELFNQTDHQQQRVFL
jgi:hypothetical protein